MMMVSEERFDQVQEDGLNKEGKQRRTKYYQEKHYNI